MQKVERESAAPPKLKTKDLLAMYRCAFYSAMGVANGEIFPTDRQCIQWLTAVRQHAEQLQIGPALPALMQLPFDWRSFPR